MKIGIISEGHADRAVITNIIVGLTGMDASDIRALRPTYITDETDKAAQLANTTSSYSIIKKECESRELIDGFLAFTGHEFVVIHIDTAEADRYGVHRPDKTNNEYCEILRELVVKQINTWVKDDLSHQLLYAVAVEEIDAWVLVLYEEVDSTKFVDPKKKLDRILRKRNEPFDPDPFNHYKSISKAFAKQRTYKQKAIFEHNCSIKLFCEEIKLKLIPKLKAEIDDDHAS